MKLLLLIFALALPASAFAQADFQDLDKLERKLVIALGADIGQPGGPRAVIDRRMKLAACPTDVTLEPNVMGAAVIRCEPLGWRIRVPLLGTPKATAATLTTTAAAPASTGVRAAAVIRRGDPVELAAGNGAFIVTSQVTADQDGAPGDRIRVHSDGKSAPLIVEVVESGRARIPGFK
jgi:flagellar basal body P-ring formation protein FlgA